MGANPKSNAVPFSTTRSNPLNQQEKFVFSQAYPSQRIAVIDKSGLYRYGKVARFSSRGRVYIRWDIQYNGAVATPNYTREYAEGKFFTNFERYVWRRIRAPEGLFIELQRVHSSLNEPATEKVRKYASRWFCPAEIREASLRVWDELGKCLHAGEVLDMQASELRTALEHDKRVKVTLKGQTSDQCENCGRCPTCGREF